MTPSSFVKYLQQLEFDHVFNPYTDRCPVHDRADAPEWRSENLLSVLEAAAGRSVDALWIGRDYSYRGGRRTGLAFTDDEHLDEHALRWGLTLRRPTRGAVVRERSANSVWNVLSRVRATVFLWNVFPFHPHQPDHPFSNRSHVAVERRSGQHLLEQLVRLLNPAAIITIGNDAEKAARRLAGPAEVVKVRHPSYGGQTEFLAGMEAYYGLR
ncbi:MAG: uracil-DNA glycosylase [Gemmatimonadetes bacterium]|nr:uracil-DNA glycosylase [Gemmatimonadota bacterium]MYD27043.1 uracil-DNA glycosylase [Gemmatimonadota bacterium]MYJ00071.1 uracil-DNA glycosylase [Gemmatimonadota bacterium]